MLSLSLIGEWFFNVASRDHLQATVKVSLTSLYLLWPSVLTAVSWIAHFHNLRIDELLCIPYH